MAKREWLGSFEQMVLLALVRLGATSGMKVRQEIEARSGRSVSIGAAYSTLERLAEADYVKSWRDEDDTDNEGRPRRFYEITGLGHKVLSDSMRGLAAMDQDLGLLGSTAGA